MRNKHKSVTEKENKSLKKKKENDENLKLNNKRDRKTLLNQNKTKISCIFFLSERTIIKNLTYLIVICFILCYYTCFAFRNSILDKIFFQKH